MPAFICFVIGFIVTMLSMIGPSMSDQYRLRIWNGADWEFALVISTCVGSLCLLTFLIASQLEGAF